MRKHIAKLLQSRSQAIRTALERYNLAAATMHPPKPQLHWDQVVEYSFLSQFDLLRSNSRQNITERPWATPAGRLAMDLYFKVQRAHEELQQLNLELQHFVTWLVDEETFLLQAERSESNVNLRFHIAQYRCKRARFHSHHLQVLTKISNLKGFTGTLEPGVNEENRQIVSERSRTWLSLHEEAEESAPEDNDEDVDEVAAAEAGKAFTAIVHAVTDAKDNGSPYDDEAM